MLFYMNVGFRPGISLLIGSVLASLRVSAQTPVVTQTNTTIRMMASNLSSGNNQRYETPGLDILKGLKPDIVAMQEFNYASTNGLGINTPAAVREMIDATFGTNFNYFRETNSGYTIPNGIISRWPMLSSGSWVDVDTGVNDRGFAWAQIDIPGTNDLYVVSVHLKASSGSANADRRTAQATNVVKLIRDTFPANAWVIVAGDCNVYGTSEAAYQCLATNFSDSPIPTDAVSGGNANTSSSRSTRYDYVFPSQSFSNQLTATAFPSHPFPNGLVFDSRIYSPLTDVAPVQSGDSAATGMQHMGVMRSFNVSYYVTNYLSNPPSAPAILSALTYNPNQQFQFTVSGTQGSNYVVQASTNLTASNWVSLKTNVSPFTFVESNASFYARRFYRAVAWP